MTRGNQRELARAKNLKKQAKAGGNKKDDGISFKSKQEHDAEIMRQKQAVSKDERDKSHEGFI
ncbi:small edrk-rich factor 2 [Linderina pennispora]|uniref:Small edrk-rich factor 2 n=1 Tax=Linderina pennispora TaxID=61395 RepID=A0A1Y1W4W3_9FUNG|nr:small edrk-rich factor 2 [Linderina pennispora]ORX68569.1 small edrk-rich factor 2 [Linderina pennispora]